MYDFLEGLCASRAAARLVLELQGVGYELTVPPGAHFPETKAGRLRAWTHLIVREDEHRLYGFPERETRDMFRLLLSVRGVGPAVAIAILSTLERSEVLQAIAGGDAARLTSVKGVGKKTAEQILLDLRDKSGKLSAAGAVLLGGPAAYSPAAAAQEQARNALVSIGFSEKEAGKALERALKQVGSTDVTLLIRTALQQ